MSDSPRGAAEPRRITRPISPLRTTAPQARPSSEVPMLCERCGEAEMYRMHAVWRCPSCGFKTDCCGW